MKRMYEEPKIEFMMLSAKENLCSVSDKDTMDNKEEWGPWQ